jgi:hypothetical protein
MFVEPVLRAATALSKRDDDVASIKGDIQVFFLPH